MSGVTAQGTTSLGSATEVGSSGSSSTGFDACGDGQLDVGEACDGDEVDGATCAELGFARGRPSCTPECTLSPVGCYDETLLQNDNGDCLLTFSCSPGGKPGNPQAAIECFEVPADVDVGLVVGLEYGIWQGAGAQLQSAPNMLVFAWDGPGSAPGELLSEAFIGVAPPAEFSQATIVPPVPFENHRFCVGLRGVELTESMAVLRASPASVPDTSFIQASLCGLEQPMPLAEGPGGNWCLRAIVGVGPVQ